MSRNLLALALSISLSCPLLAQTTLTYSDHEPFGNMRTRFIQDEFFKTVELESKGDIKIESHWNAELSDGYNALKNISTEKKADMAVIVPEYPVKELPLHQLFKSFAVGPTGAAQVEYLRNVYQNIPELNAELDAQNVQLLLIATGYPVAFYSPQLLEDLTKIKGQKWRSASFWHLDHLNNAGAEGVRMPWGPEVVNALEEGRLNGLMVNIDSGKDIGAHKSAPYILTSPQLWLGHIYLVAMNKERWNSLSQEERQAFQRAAESVYPKLGALMDNSYINLIEELKKEGATVRMLSKPEVSVWEKASQFETVQDKWVTTQENQGMANVRSVLEKLRAAITENNN